MTDHTPDLQAICDSCLTPIAAGDGHVWLDQGAAHEAIRELRAEQAADAAPTDVHLWYDDDRAGTRWHTTHTECAPHKTPAAYAIEVERIDTWAKFLHWTVHLMNKGWVEATDWDMFALRSLEPHQEGLSGIRPIRPQDLAFRGIGW